LRHAERTPVPWANGLGRTREVDRSGSGSAGDAGFDWRISVADIDRSGAFSSLPGVDRTIVVVGPSGLVLSVDGTSQVLGRLTPFSFPGDATTTCEVSDGPTQALNVMTDRGRCSATAAVLAVAGRIGLRAGPGEELLVLATTDGLAAGDRSSSRALAPLDVVRGPAVEVHGEGTVAVVRLRTLP
jgi:environmental stress-induced protein Ves